MSLLLCLILFLATADPSSATYCLCRDGLDTSALQKTIDYACGAGADCTPILQNGPCFQPNTVKDHCNYAANSYFQRKGQGPGACDFSGTATPSSNPPSNVATGCSYPSSASTAGTTTGTTTGSTTGTTGTPSSVYGGGVSTTGLGPTGIDNPSDACRPLFSVLLFFSSLMSTTAGLWLWS